MESTGTLGAMRYVDRADAGRILAGYVAGMLIGYNGFMWSQAVIVEVYPLSLLSFLGVL